ADPMLESDYYPGTCLPPWRGQDAAWSKRPDLRSDFNRLPLDRLSRKMRPWQYSSPRTGS
ncbi:MAG: hypothetical protein ACXW36_11500, partial [Nitrospira sp.]